MRRTVQENLRENERRSEALEDMLGIGTNSSVNQREHTAKVVLDDDETVSDDFPILARSFYCSHCKQTHDWMPKKGETVAYLIRPGGDGIILGGIG